MVPQFWPDCTSETDECCLSVGRTRWTGACETVVLLLRYYSHFQEVIFAPTLSPHCSVRRDKVPFLSGCESRPATVVCGRLRECKPFLRLLLCPRQRSGSPSPAIAPVEHGPASQLARNKLPARSAAAVTQRAGAERRTRASGLTAAGDRAHRRCLSVSGKRSLLQVAWCMRSGAVVCPASLIAAY